MKTHPDGISPIEKEEDKTFRASSLFGVTVKRMREIIFDVEFTLRTEKNIIIAHKKLLKKTKSYPINERLFYSFLQGRIQGESDFQWRLCRGKENLLGILGATLK